MTAAARKGKKTEELWIMILIQQCYCQVNEAWEQINRLETNRKKIMVRRESYIFFTAGSAASSNWQDQKEQDLGIFFHYKLGNCSFGQLILKVNLFLNVQGPGELALQVNTM